MGQMRALSSPPEASDQAGVLSQTMHTFLHAKMEQVS